MNNVTIYQLYIGQTEAGKWYFWLACDDQFVTRGSERENERDAMLEATCFLNSTNQKPK